MDLNGWLTLRIAEITHKIEHYQYTTPAQLRSWKMEVQMLLEMRQQLQANYDREDLE